MIEGNSPSPKALSSYQLFWRRITNYEIFWLILLALSISLFHWRGIKPGYTFLPVDLANNNLPWRGTDPQPLQNSLVSDPLYQFFPFLNQAVVTVSEARQWPLWNPTIMLGHPSLGDPLAQPFFPLLLLLGLVFGVARGFAIGLWLLVLLGAGLAYGWLRIVGNKSIAAFMGAISYALAGYLITWFETHFWVSTLALLPGILLAFELARKRNNLRYAALAALLMGAAILGGQLQFVIIFVFFLGLYASGRVVETRLATGRFAFFPLLLLGIIVVLGGLLGCLLLLPAAELLSLSRRVVENGLTDALPWQQLITLLVPQFFGTPTAPPYYWGPGNYSENTIYASIVALLLAALAPFTNKRFFTFFMSGIVVATIYFIVGGPGISFLGRIPGINYASLHRTSFILPLLIGYLAARTLNAPRISFRAALLVALIFTGIMLAALFFDLGAAKSHWDYLQGEVTKAALLLVLVLGLLWTAEFCPTCRSLVNWAIAALVFVDLLIFGSQFNPVGPVEQLMPLTPVTAFLQESEPQRVVALQQNDRVLYGPNTLSLFGLAEAGGYSSLVVDRYHQLVSAGDPELDVSWMDRQGNMVTFSVPSTRLLDLFQVSHVVSAEAIDVTAVRTEIAHDPCAGQSDLLSSSQPVEGEFTVSETAINRLDFTFFVAEESRGMPVDLRVRLWQGARGERLVLDQHHLLSTSAEQELIILFFAPERDAPGQTYFWEISSDAQQTGVALCLGTDGEPALAVYGSDWRAVYQEDLYVYERLAAVPRAYVVYAAEQITDEASTVQRLLDETFPIRYAAVTADPLPLPASTETLATPAELVVYTDTQVIIKANARAQGLLILGDQFHPGWQVSVNGKAVPLLRVNHIMRGVLLEPGEHEIVFHFLPHSLRQGLLLTAVGLALISALAALNATPPSRLMAKD